MVVLTKATEDGGDVPEVRAGIAAENPAAAASANEQAALQPTPPITRSVINAPRYTFNLNSTECRRSLTCARFILGPSPVAGVNLAQNYGDGPGRPC